MAGPAKDAISALALTNNDAAVGIGNLDHLQFGQPLQQQDHLAVQIARKKTVGDISPGRQRWLLKSHNRI
jgi:hypothetical protein